MKLFQKSFCSFLFFILLLSFHVNAQSIQTVTPSNVNQSANEIKEIFGDLIGVSVEEIEDFYNHHWSESLPYGSSCQAPNAKVISVNGSEANFDWTVGAAAPPEDYRVSTLRLTDGLPQTTTTGDNSITLTIPKAIHLVVFQSNCETERSALDIIIIERIMFYTGCDCNCRNFQEVWSEEFHPGSGIPSYTWDPGSSSNQYLYKISYNYPAGLTASFKANIGFDDNTPIWVQMDMNSMNNFHFNDDDSFIFAQQDETEVFLGPVTFAQNPDAPEDNTPVLSYNPVYAYSFQRGRVELYECRDKIKSRESILSTNIASNKIYRLKEVSHSFDSNKTIEYHLPEDKSISIYLLNNQGSIVQTVVNHTKKEAGSYQQNLDLSAYPNGTYFCILKTDQEVIPLSLLKTN